MAHYQPNKKNKTSSPKLAEQKIRREKNQIRSKKKERDLSKAKMAEDLVLDTAIRDWVLIPLSVVMVLIGVLRYFVSKLMKGSSQIPDPKIVKEGFFSKLFLLGFNEF